MMPTLNSISRSFLVTCKVIVWLSACALMCMAYSLYRETERVICRLKL